MKMYKHLFKRIFDFLFSLILIILLSPVLAITVILLFFVNDRKPFFTQLRPGKKGKPFHIVKFKTMNDRKGPEGKLLPDTERLTAVGRIVRSFSIDELPQLFNVLLGDMSIVGPRPLLTAYLERYSTDQKRRHEVRPGITGWAQVNGRNTINWEQKFIYDVWYVDHISLLLDCRILWLTLRKVFMRDGINQNSATTMEEFKGSDIK